VRKWIVRIGIALVVLFGLAQLVPYGRAHSNPAVTAEPKWDSAQTRRLAQDACFDCHSNETKYPWYSNIAPSSWLLARDVDGGRKALDFSEWNRPQHELDDAIAAIRSGEMPPWYYAIMHPKARLSAAEKAQLEQGLDRTFRASPPG
jgi:mono/diheme cytochrome c family protein